MKHLREETPDTLVVRRVVRRQLPQLPTSGGVSLWISCAQELLASLAVE